MSAYTVHQGQPTTLGATDLDILEDHEADEGAEARPYGDEHDSPACALLAEGHEDGTHHNEESQTGEDGKPGGNGEQGGQTREDANSVDPVADEDSNYYGDGARYPEPCLEDPSLHSSILPHREASMVQTDGAWSSVLGAVGILAPCVACSAGCLALW
jgi:hypothetical protein